MPAGHFIQIVQRRDGASDGLERAGVSFPPARSPFISPKNLQLDTIPMHASHWGDRVYRRDAAARCCGLHPKNLDTLIIRMRTADVLFSERKGGARVFSARDICVLRIAWELEQAGQTWLTALARAFDNLQGPPPEHAILVTPATSVSSKSSWLTTVAPQPGDKTLITIPIGRFCAEVLGKLRSELVAV